MTLFPTFHSAVDFEPPAPMPRTSDPESATKAVAVRIQSRKDLIAEIQGNGMQTPLEFMIRVLNDENLPRNERMDAAKAAIPYVHSRLNSIDVNANVNISHEDALAFLESED